MIYKTWDNHLLRTLTKWSIDFRPMLLNFLAFISHFKYCHSVKYSAWVRINAWFKRFSLFLQSISGWKNNLLGLWRSSFGDIDKIVHWLQTNVSKLFNKNCHSVKYSAWVRINAGFKRSSLFLQSISDSKNYLYDLGRSPFDKIYKIIYRLQTNASKLFNKHYHSVKYSAWVRINA